MTSKFGGDLDKYRKIHGYKQIKEEFDRKFSLIHKLIDQKQSTKENLNMNGFAIQNLPWPKETTEPATKEYCDDKDRLVTNYCNEIMRYDLMKNEEEFHPKTLIEIGKSLLKAGCTNENLVRKVAYCEKLRKYYRYLFDDSSTGDSDSDDEIEIFKNISWFWGLKYKIINIINQSEKETFKAYKKQLMDDGLVYTPDNNSIHKKVRRFINKLAQGKRDDEILELMIQKNHLCLDMKILYINEELLKELLDKQN